jgi:hypothetical protein
MNTRLRIEQQATRVQAELQVLRDLLATLEINDLPAPEAAPDSATTPTTRTSATPATPATTRTSARLLAERGVSPRTINEEGFYPGDRVQIKWDRTGNIFAFSKKKWKKTDVEGKVVTISRVTRKCIWYEKDGVEHRKANHNVILLE